MPARIASSTTANYTIYSYDLIGGAGRVLQIPQVPNAEAVETFLRLIPVIGRFNDPVGVNPIHSYRAKGPGAKHWRGAPSYLVDCTFRDVLGDRTNLAFPTSFLGGSPSGRRVDNHDA